MGERFRCEFYAVGRYRVNCAYIERANSDLSTETVDEYSTTVL